MWFTWAVGTVGTVGIMVVAIVEGDIMAAVIMAEDITQDLIEDITAEAITRDRMRVSASQSLDLELALPAIATARFTWADMLELTSAEVTSAGGIGAAVLATITD